MNYKTYGRQSVPLALMFPFSKVGQQKRNRRSIKERLTQVAVIARLIQLKASTTSLWLGVTPTSQGSVEAVRYLSVLYYEPRFFREQLSGRTS